MAAITVSAGGLVEEEMEEEVMTGGAWVLGGPETSYAKGCGGYS